ncbi:MAG: hypothetical protein Sylvanvirus22_10 [Sylvanvirus sp.]|uniref:Tc1-like transposase DDE domain-containing protein n=1 Tax=Sylvanvirus sp. TaxID=2487774 RepID=A0A3G5AK55_9VIRU|nr:MAG: hypothetical protein Sylvanvirus22_10 [Sylvanvirus sp.]
MKTQEVLDMEGEGVSDNDGSSEGDNDNDINGVEIDDDKEDFCSSPVPVPDAAPAPPPPPLPSGLVSLSSCMPPPKRPQHYSGSSSRTQRRKRQLLASASSGCHSISTFFTSGPPLEPEEEILPIDVAISLLNELPILQNDTKKVKFTDGSNGHFEITRAKAVKAYLYEWRDQGATFRHVKSSEAIAKTLWPECFYSVTYRDPVLHPVGTGSGGVSASLSPTFSDVSYMTPPSRVTPTSVPPTPKYRGELIRRWAEYYLKHGDFPERKHGKHQKILPLILDQDIRLTLLKYLRSLNSKQTQQLTSSSFANWINKNIYTTMPAPKANASQSQSLVVEANTIHSNPSGDEDENDDDFLDAEADLEFLEEGGVGNVGGHSSDEKGDGSGSVEGEVDRQPIHISPSTAQRWLKHLGFNNGEVKKGIYADGHERRDVVTYRDNVFVPQMLALKKQMTLYSSFSGLSRPPVLQPDEKEIVWVVQDECTFAAHDARQCIWMEDGKPPLRPKGSGRIIMISEFLCPCHGRMKFNGRSTGEIIEPGATHDGYWENKDVVRQLKKVIPIFNALHPGKVALFTFDNSTNHQAKADDALVVNRLKLSDGFPAKTIKGKDVTRTKTLRNGWYTNSLGQRVEHVMTTRDGTQKGIKRILDERGLWREGMDLKEGRILLSQQMDFKLASYSSLIKETIYQAGHKFLFFPKFHPELNPIELYWGWAKRYTRSHCDFEFENLKRVVPQALDATSLMTIRKFFNHCWRYMKAYNHTDPSTQTRLSANQVEWAIKKYSSHRRLKDSDLSEINFLTDEFLERRPST